MEYDNNHFIIASRAYSLQVGSPVANWADWAFSWSPRWLTWALMLPTAFKWSPPSIGHWVPPCLLGWFHLPSIPRWAYPHHRARARDNTRDETTWLTTGDGPRGESTLGPTHAGSEVAGESASDQIETSSSSVVSCSYSFLANSALF
jgi:hypothetical protein